MNLAIPPVVPLTPDLQVWPVLLAGLGLAILMGALLAWTEHRPARRAVRVRRSSIFERTGSFAYAHPALVLFIWAPFVTAGFLAFPRLSGVLSEGGLVVEGSGSLRARQAIEQSFPGYPDSMAFLVFTSSDLVPTDAEYVTTVDRIARAATRIPGVSQVVRPGELPGMVGKDGRTEYALVGLRGEGGAVVEAGRRLTVLAESVRGHVHAYATGQAPLASQFIGVASEDLAKAERIGLPVAAIVLLFAFGTVVAAGLPMAIAAAGLALGFGILFALAHVFDIGAIAENASTMIGLAVGIDYALFILTRYREEVAIRGDRRVAATRAIATAGRAVFFSGITVVLGLSGLLLVGVPMLRTTALGPISVVIVSVAAALTLMPVFLRLAGAWIDRVRVPWLRPWRPSVDRGMWVRWARVVMRRPVLFVVASGALLLAMATPTFGMKLGNPGVSSSPASLQARQGYEALAGAFEPGLLGPIQVVVRAPGAALSSSVAGAIDRFQRVAERDATVAHVDSFLEVLPDPSVLEQPGAAFFILSNPRARAALGQFVNVDGGRDVTIVTVEPTVAPDTPQAGLLVRRIRERYVPAAFGGLQVAVGGPAAENLDAERALVSSIPKVYGFVVALSFVLLLLVFRSVLIPLKAVLMNLLSVGAAFGVLVLVFQRGHAAGLLGVEVQPFIDFVTPLIVFAALFGLSMDYEVFLLSRMREEYVRTHRNEAAVAMGLQTTGRTITAAASIMVVVFSAFVATRLVAVKQIGLGLAVAVLVDATLVRIVLVPAAMRLLGTWNWWLPRFIERRLPAIEEGDAQVRETQPKPSAPARPQQRPEKPAA